MFLFLIYCLYITFQSCKHNQTWVTELVLGLRKFAKYILLNQASRVDFLDTQVYKSKESIIVHFCRSFWMFAVNPSLCGRENNHGECNCSYNGYGTRWPQTLPGVKEEYFSGVRKSGQLYMMLTRESACLFMHGGVAWGVCSSEKWNLWRKVGIGQRCGCTCPGTNWVPGHVQLQCWPKPALPGHQKPCGESPWPYCRLWPHRCL